MTTNFFDLLYSMMTDSIDLTMTISKNGNDSLVVALMPIHNGVTDPAKFHIRPLRMNGTLEQFRETFFTAIEQPVQKDSGLIKDMYEHQQASEKALKESKMQADKEEKEKKAKEDRKKKFDLKMKKVEELEGKKKWGEAIGALPSAKEFPEQAAEIKKKENELRQKHGSLSLFEAPTPTEAPSQEDGEEVQADDTEQPTEEDADEDATEDDDDSSLQYADEQNEDTEETPL